MQCNYRRGYVAFEYIPNEDRTLKQSSNPHNYLIIITKCNTAQRAKAQQPGSVGSGQWDQWVLPKVPNKILHYSPLTLLWKSLTSVVMSAGGTLYKLSVPMWWQHCGKVKKKNLLHV